MKEIFTSPPAFIPYISSHPAMYKLSAMKSEMIRIRRTCPKQRFIKLLDKMLLRELTTLGHKSASSDIAKYEGYISANYDEDYQKIKQNDIGLVSDQGHENSRVFGATTVMKNLNMLP